MSERLDRLEALLIVIGDRLNETSARLDRTAAQQARHTDEIDTLLGAISTNEVEIRNLTRNMAESNQRFDNLRADAIADRQRIDRKIEEDRQRFNNLRDEAIADRRQIELDREEYRQRFEAGRRQGELDREEYRQQADLDREEYRQRFDAQQGVIQRLLAELVATNQDVRRIGDRVQNLEAG